MGWFILEFLEFSEFLYFLVYIHSYTGGYVDEASEFLSILGCKLCLVCLKPPRKVGPWGLPYIHIYIYTPYPSLHLNDCTFFVGT